MLLGKGQYYYGGFPLGNSQYTYELATDPATNGGQYADVKLLSETRDERHHGDALLDAARLAGLLFHGDPDASPAGRALSRSARGEWLRGCRRSFNWLTADARRNFSSASPSNKGAKVPNSPHEITVNLNGTRQGEFADKFIYGQDHADLKAWGWSSVGQGGLNVGIWMMTNMEFSNGGPMKRDVSVYPYSELNNSILTGELGMGSDGFLAQGEVWTKTCGPWFIYMNHVPATIAAPREAARRCTRTRWRRRTRRRARGLTRGSSMRSMCPPPGAAR